MTFKEIDIEADDEAAHEAPTAPVDITKINTLHELLGLAIGDFQKVLAVMFSLGRKPSIFENG